VVRTRVGYAGGTKANPTYYDLGNHTETVQVDYDPSRISYADLLKVFWDSHNPSLQSGTQYLNIAFYHNEEQHRLILESKAQVESEHGKIVTKILPYSGFNLAEDYHQKYYLMNESGTITQDGYSYDRSTLIKDFRAMYPDIRGMIDSTAAARINGYLAGNGSKKVLTEELESYGLSEEGNKVLLYIAGMYLPD